MARYAQFDFYQQSPSTLDVTPSEEDDMSVLDDKILDSTSPSLSDPHRSSYDASDAFPHRNSIWSNYSHASSDHSRPSHLASTLDSTTTNFMSVDGPQSYGQSTACIRQSPRATPPPPFSGGAVGPVGSIPVGAVSYRNSMGFGPPGGVAMSPQSSQGWMPAPMDLADAPAQSKGPSFRNSSPLTVRRDGIRKKNARFEIPAERTLSNIDHLISQSTNDDEIKELKQQKRLLRNRQAALDSRQRKKLHTEKLEEEKKHYTQAIGRLEEAVTALQKREAELMREKGEWIAQQQQVTQYLEGLHIEKDEMIRVHTLETAELRKKNNILMETVEKFERGVKPGTAEPHANDFTGFENLSMEGHPWEEFNMANGMPMANGAPAPATNPSHSLAPVNSRAPEKSNPPTSDYPFSWNAFYMCLLFGAFIASNNASWPGQSLPQMSEEYRAESANVLKAVLASSPSDLPRATNNAAVSASAAVGPGPSTIPSMDLTQMGAAPGGSSSLDELHDTLVMPTEEQERAQVFAMNPDQYNSLTTFEDDAGFKPQQPSNLQQALAAMRNNVAQHRMQDASTSDVYSRSLMWERVPSKVIQDFRRMVQEYGAAPVKQEMTDFPSV
ncbi:hypothetical protein N7492_001377 [Penicillium capsulatum]|uniref:BZIP domain-containing protein n=1 Tax=Penicillium capsulatum TaxID=69766 RepID=A0A9W9LZC3_9EURO|nr:hypothetical protein N7492_001377 [Penicillium capsulatum]